MDMIGKLRRMKLRDHFSDREIFSRTGLARNTVKNWLKTRSVAVRSAMASADPALPEQGDGDQGRSVLKCPKTMKDISLEIEQLPCSKCAVSSLGCD